MSEEDNLNASIAHIVLCCVAGQGLGRGHARSYTHPGMHANFFIHGVVGFLHYQSKTFNNDFKKAYAISYTASRYLPLPCLMADLYRGDSSLSTIHLVSGLIPFAMAMAGNENAHLGNLMVACNIVSLCIYSQQHDRMWGWYTAGAGILAYFFTPQSGKHIAYPLCLALMEYCATEHRADIWPLLVDIVSGLCGAGTKCRLRRLGTADKLLSQWPPLHNAVLIKLLSLTPAKYILKYPII